MSDFLIAYGNIRNLEQGYVYNPRDTGGETYAGISRVNNPTWIGWENIDTVKKTGLSHEGLNKVLNSDVELQNIIKEFYLKEYWQKYKLGEIKDQLVSDKIFDIFVNMSPKSASIIVQISLNQIKDNFVEVDGIMGTKTINAINNCYPLALLAFLRLNQIAKYAKIVTENKSQSVFLLGWINRALS